MKGIDHSRNDRVQCEHRHGMAGKIHGQDIRVKLTPRARALVPATPELVFHCNLCISTMIMYDPNAVYVDMDSLHRSRKL